MLVTLESIKILKIGDEVFVAKSFQIPDRFTYMGIVDSSLSKHYIFADGYNPKVLSLCVDCKNPGQNAFTFGYVFTTYEECCEKMREICINTIEHFNKHQLKNNPIKYK